MKKKIITWICVALALVLLIGTIRTLQYPWVFPHQVQRISLWGYHSCGGGSSKNVELTRSEINQVLLWYNLSAYDGWVDAESCESDYHFVIDLEDGRQITIRECHFRSAQIEVSPADSDEKFWLRSGALDRFALELLEKYDLADS